MPTRLRNASPWAWRPNFQRPALRMFSPARPLTAARLRQMSVSRLRARLRPTATRRRPYAGRKFTNVDPSRPHPRHKTSGAPLWHGHRTADRVKMPWGPSCIRGRTPRRRGVTALPPKMRMQLQMATRVQFLECLSPHIGIRIQGKSFACSCIPLHYQHINFDFAFLCVPGPSCNA